METILKVTQVLPLVERNYTDRNGQSQVMASKGVLMTNGSDTIYAELVGDKARLTELDVNVLYTVQLQINARMWKDKNLVERYSTDVVITKIARLL